ncbi:MAG: hypothetical protein A2X94_04095 [Bdellovibrionales bacterium GWB1_55_8]|nr:MAG: hypothetical protein A2X94_04095 [Bdellovibrionales bacterium GWB1_55_8]
MSRIAARHFPLIVLLTATLTWASSVIGSAEKPEAAPAKTRYSATAISTTDVFAGTLKTTSGMEPESAFWKINLRTGTTSSIELPAELRDREIVGILPAKQGVYVISQYTIEQGDQPLVHHFDTGPGRWKRVGQVDCPAFSVIHSSKKDLTFECEELDESGKTMPKKKSLALLKQFPVTARDLKIPQTQDAAASREVRLQGTPFEWDSLKVRLDKKEKTYDASALTTAHESQTKAPAPRAQSGTSQKR